MTESFSRDEIECSLAEQQARVGLALAPFEASSTMRCLLDMLRAVEELINLHTIGWDDDEFERQLFGFPVIRSSEGLLLLKSIRKSLARRLTKPRAGRLRWRF
jgi:hypothetical protein